MRDVCELSEKAYNTHSNNYRNAQNKQETNQYKGRSHKSPDTVRTKTPNFAISIEEKE